MSRSIEQLATQSLLDRLGATEDWPTTRAQSLRMLREGLKRDMEWLLNTRRALMPGLETYPQAYRSVLQYGLIDTSSLSQSSAADHTRLQKAVQRCIEEFEPRLQNVRVALGQDDLKRRQLRFHIEGQIRMDPAPEEISFDTVLDLTSGEYQVN